MSDTIHVSFERAAFLCSEQETANSVLKTNEEARTRDTHMNHTSGFLFMPRINIATQWASDPTTVANELLTAEVKRISSLATAYKNADQVLADQILDGN